MIAYIKGILVNVSPDGSVVVENHGIGYFVTMPAGKEQIPKSGSEVKIFIHMHVREDNVSLFGFFTEEELEAFRLLIGVNGIGPKVALSVLSTLTVYELKIAVLSQDTKTISKTPGLGPKGAGKLILELKDKLDLDEFDTEDTGMDLEMSAAKDAVMLTAQGLVSLGYSKVEAMEAIHKVENAEAISPEELLKQALKKMIG